MCMFDNSVRSVPREKVMNNSMRMAISSASSSFSEYGSKGAPYHSRSSAFPGSNGCIQMGLTGKQKGPSWWFEVIPASVARRVR